MNQQAKQLEAQIQWFLHTSHDDDLYRDFALWIISLSKEIQRKEQLN